MLVVSGVEWLQMNVVKGLKMYEEIFMESELSKLAEFVTQLRAFGRNGKLSGKIKYHFICF